jgi:hypothetical protein
MKLLIVFLLCSVIHFKGISQTNTVYYQFDNVYFMTLVPGAGERKIEVMAKVVNDYFSSIENNEFDAWQLLLSDSTKTRIIEKKIKNKYERLKGYGFVSDSLAILSVVQLPKAYGNEIGTEYELTIGFGVDLKVENRVSFDHMKLGKEKSNVRLMGINIVTEEKGYKICLHKYFADGENKQEAGDE